MQWIDVEVDLPEPMQVVLVCDHISKFVTLGRLIEEDDGFYFYATSMDKLEPDYQVTYWMPLPEYADNTLEPACN